MNYWKLGCRWGSKKDGLPLFLELLLKHNIVISWVDKNFGVNSKIILTDGHTVIGIAKTISSGVSSNKYPELKEEFEKYQIPFHSDLLIFKSQLFEIEIPDRFDYKLVQGICGVNDNEIISKTEKLYSKYLKKMETESIINLLTYKKQIILQGPPGTGKTREAKLIAETIIFGDIKIDMSYFREIVKSLKEVSATKNNNPIIIDNFIDDLISFKETRFIPKYNFTIQELYDCYITGDFQKKDFVQYSQYAKRCLVLQIVDTFQKTVNREQFKLIQFHPTYAYEDFVRGIVAESKVDKIEYKNVNKTLGLFAEEAFKNYKASNNTTSESNIEAWINSKFEEFKNNIEAKLPEEETLLSGDITIFEVTDTDFKYAKSWQTPGYLKFNEFKKLVKAIILNEFELSNKQLDKEKFIHAHYRYTYYNALLKKFFESYEYKGESYSELPKNYVLIIDEINRANLSSVLGELIYALEYRGEAVESIYAVDDETKLILPPNLYVIGTMNTADRSVGHIDYAIRRRFAFVDVLPVNLKEKQGVQNFHEVLFLAVEKIFQEHISPEFEVNDVQLGHSYFIDKSEDENGAGMDIRFEYEIKPILLEYVKDGVLIGRDIKNKIEDLKTLI